MQLILKSVQPKALHEEVTNINIIVQLEDPQ